MSKKILVFGFCMIMLIILSGCPDKEKSQKEGETDKIPNTMEKTATELEQVITLLGGPMFDSRDKIEQMKNEQIQLLVNESAGKAQQSLGSDKSEQNQSDNDGEKGDNSQEESQGEKQESGQDKTGGKEQSGQKNSGQDEEQNSEKEEKQDQSSKKEGEQDQSSKKEGEQDQSSKKEGEQDQEPKQEGSDKDKGGSKEQGGSKTESGQMENAADEQDSQRPSPPEKGAKAFQMEDSLFGIPQWKDENWKMIKVLTDGMHFSWNGLQPQILEKGASQAQIASFTTALENLSNAVQAQTIKEAQTASFQLSQALSEFYSFYKTDVPPELQRINSAVTGIHFSVRQNDWGKAQELSNLLQQEFIKLKAGVEDNQSDVLKMLEISLNDLGGAVQKQDAVLVMIRTNMVTANIQELDTQLSQKKK